MQLNKALYKFIVQPSKNIYIHTFETSKRWLKVVFSLIMKKIRCKLVYTSVNLWLISGKNKGINQLLICRSLIAIAL